MTRTSLLATIFVASLIICPAQASSAPPIKVVAVVNGQIVADPLVDGGIVLTRDTARKSLPTWSNDGTKIAYIASISPKLGLAALIVINTSGQEIARFPIEPVKQDDSYSGMQFVESVEWLNNSAIVVGGSINPSQTQYYIFYLSGSRNAVDFVDDQSSPGFSPNGLHYAFKTGIPHWGRSVANQPKLLVDGMVVFPRTKSLFDFLDGPYWSSDSSQAALLVSEHNNDLVEVAIWHLNGGPVTLIPTQIAVSQSSALFWLGSRLFVSSVEAGADGIKKVSEVPLTGGVPMVAAVDSEILSLSNGLHMRAELQSQFEGHAEITQPDFWCESCSLSMLPRRVTAE